MGLVYDKARHSKIFTGAQPMSPDQHPLVAHRYSLPELTVTR